MRESPRVSLRPYSDQGRKDVEAIRLAPEQREMIPSIRSSLSMAAEHDQARTHVICSERGDVIGLTIYGVDETTQKWKIFRLFVDQSVQGQGVGTAAINMLVEILKQDLRADEILIAYQLANAIARHVYSKAGFVEYAAEGSKILASLDLNNSKNPHPS